MTDRFDGIVSKTRFRFATKDTPSVKRIRRKVFKSGKGKGCDGE